MCAVLTRMQALVDPLYEVVYGCCCKAQGSQQRDRERDKEGREKRSDLVPAVAAGLLGTHHSYAACSFCLLLPSKLPHYTLYVYWMRVPCSARFLSLSLQFYLQWWLQYKLRKPFYSYKLAASTVWKRDSTRRHLVESCCHCCWISLSTVVVRELYFEGRLLGSTPGG